MKNVYVIFVNGANFVYDFKKRLRVALKKKSNFDLVYYFRKKEKREEREKGYKNFDKKKCILIGMIYCTCMS